MRELLIQMKTTLEEKKACVLVVIVRASGSTPRKTGAMMLVGEEGILSGTIGGGNLEHHCMKKGQTFAVDEEGCIETYVLDHTKAEELGMICGGNTDVLYLPISEKEHLDVVSHALEMIEQKLPMDVVFDLEKKSLYIEQVEAKVRGVNNHTPSYLRIPLMSQRRIIVVGAGHVARELGRMLEYLDFRYLVVDDRSEFATSERFAKAEAVIVTPLEDMGDALERTLEYPIGENDGICIMTRGHAGDTEALRYALRTEASYIGVMGSKRKRETVLSTLEGEGFVNVRERVITPIGLDIGAQTPEELAISIAGELIKWRAGKE